MYLPYLTLCCKDDQINLDKEILVPIKKLGYVFHKVSSSHKTVILLYSPSAHSLNKCVLAPQTLWREWGVEMETG